MSAIHQDEWKTIYELYYKPMYIYALSLTGNRQDAEDLLQETFVKAYLSYKEGGSLKYWLIKVLQNEFYNLKRKRQKEVYDSEEESLFRTMVSKEDLLEDLIAQEDRRALFLAIQKLPQQMKEILMESTYMQMKDKDIADLHKISQENVRKIRSRAKQKLIDQLKEEK